MAKIFKRCSCPEDQQDIDTARKHGLGAYEILHQLMLGNAWLPPARTISP